MLDLEGDPQLPWKERIDLYHVEKDVASLVRSLSYIKIAALKKSIEDTLHLDFNNDATFSLVYPLLFLCHHEPIAAPALLLQDAEPEIVDRLTSMVDTLNDWETKMKGTIIASYQETHTLDPGLLQFYTLQRILNEISYEIMFRPRNFFIPLIGLIELLHQDLG